MNVIWGSTIAWYLFLAGLAAGSFATAVLVTFKDRGLVKVQLVGRIIALLALATGLFLLMFDAEAGFKNPLRFFYLLTNFNSVMAWGVVILGVFGCTCLVTLLLTLFKRKVPRVLDGLGIVMAVCTAAYTGVLIGVIKTYPLWNTALLPVLFVVSALSAGMAGTFIISTFVAHGELEKLGMLKKLHVALPLIELALLAILLYMTSATAPAGQLSVNRLISGDLAPFFWFGLIAVGLIVPLIAGSVSSFIQGRSGTGVAGEGGFARESGAGEAGEGAEKEGADTDSGIDTSAAAHADDGVDVSAGVGAGAAAAWAMELAGDAGSLVGGFLLRYLIIVAAVPLTFIF
jgi:formate-dependent nitrite reductase membrane component NrfD